MANFKQKMAVAFMSWQDNLKNSLFLRKNYKKLFYKFLRDRRELISFTARTTNDTVSNYLDGCHPDLYLLNAFGWIDYDNGDELDRWSELNQHWQIELKNVCAHNIHNSKARVYDYVPISSEFKLFLADHGVYHRFKSNMSLPAIHGSSYDVYSMSELFKQDRPWTWVLEAFNWGLAPEHDYCWSNIHNSWYEMVK